MGIAFAQVNEILIQGHLAPLPFDPVRLKVIKDHSLNPLVSMWMFQTTANASVYCSPESGALCSIYRGDIKYSEGPGFKSPPRPTWTKDQAILVAKKYAVALFGAFPENVGPPHASYDAIQDVPLYYPGIWTVRWPRVDQGGHIFAADSLGIKVSEEKGLTSAALNFFSNYTEPTGPLISKVEAINAAHSAGEYLARKWIGGNVQLEPPSDAFLIIINPNKMLEADAIETGANASKTARLVWVVEYPVTLDTSSDKHGSQVWVDAQTKAVLGGDCL